MERKNGEVRKIPSKYSSIIFYSLTVLIWPLAILSYVIFLVYRNIVNIILHLKTGKSYGGLFDSADTVFHIRDVTRTVMTTVLILKSEKEIDLLYSLKKKVQEKVFDYPQHYPKLTNTFHTFLGYSYWLQNDLKVDDCVKLLPIPNSKDHAFNEEYLKYLTGKLCNSPLPKNDTASWEIFVSRKNLGNIKENNHYYYPIIIRFHHSICDGISLVTWITNTLSDDISQNYCENIFNNLSKNNDGKATESQNTQNYFKEIISLVQFFLNLVFVSMGTILKMTFLRAADKNPLHGPELSGDKIVAWASENIRLVPIVKGIKARVPNTRFSDVVFTAVSASLTNVIKKRSPQEVPEFISSLIPILYQHPHIQTSGYVKLKNTASPAILELPSVKSSLVEALEEVKIKSEEMRCRPDILITNFFVTYVAGVYPVQILKILTNCNTYTNIITNIPGGGRIKLLDDCILEKAIPLAPNSHKIGVSITILTYDDKFQLGIMLDKKLVPCQEEAQKIVDDIFYYIKVLDEETSKLYS